MKCYFCEDKALNRIDVTGNQNFRRRDEDDVFFREEEPGDEKVSEIFACDDHNRLWELMYGGEVEEEGIKEEERKELEENAKKVNEEIEQIRERIRRKNKELQK